MAGDAVRDDDGDSDEEVPEKVERVKPREFCLRHFDTLKKSIKLADRAIEIDDRELRDLNAAANRCVAAMSDKNSQGLQKATSRCREILQDINHKADALEAAEKSEGAEIPRTTAAQMSDVPSVRSRGAALSLDKWRPAPRPPQAVPSRNEASEKTQDVSAEEPINNNEACAAPEATGTPKPHMDAELLRRKEQADSMTRDGDYAGAYVAYERLLEEVHTVALDEVRIPLHVALCSNSALCALKLSATQGSWSRAKLMLQRTLAMCDRALQMDSTHAKSHFRRACALEALERFSDAHQAYSRAARFEPADPRINSGIDRSYRYLEAQLGPETLEDELKRRGLLKGARTAFGAKASQIPKPRRRSAATALSACCRCSNDAGEGWCAIPCGHGPFCGSCKAWLDADGKGLTICPICKSHPAVAPGPGIIARWEEGFGEPVTPDYGQLEALAEERVAQRQERREGKEAVLSERDATSTTSARQSQPDFCDEQLVAGQTAEDVRHAHAEQAPSHPQLNTMD